MHGFHKNLEEITKANHYFRQVIFTAPHSQLVLMSLKPQEEIGMEVHTVDQFFRFEEGEGMVIIDDEGTAVHAGDGVIVPAGSHHNVINTSKIESLQLYTIYSPAQHPDGTIHETKADALEAEKHE